MANITAYLPPVDVPEGESVSGYVRKIAEAALSAGLKPAPLPEVGLFRTSIYLPAALHGRLEQIPSSMPLGRTLGALVKAWLNQQSAAGNERGGDQSSLASCANQLRPEQKRFLDGMLTGLAAGKIVLAEASTGVGKSRAIAIAAQELLMRKIEPVIIAAPTISVLTHLLTEWNQVPAPGPVSLAVVLGRSQFVDPQALQDVFLDPEFASFPEMTQAKAWFEKGGPVETEKTRILQELRPDIRWLTDDLAHVAPTFPVKDVVLNGNGREPGEAGEIYRSMREAAMSAEVIFCTHAMLALDCMVRGRRDADQKILPDRGAIFIDEAHEFEETVARIHGRDLSLLRLKQTLKRGIEGEFKDERLVTAAQKALKGCRAAEAACQRFSGDVSFVPDNIATDLDQKRASASFAVNVKRLKESFNELALVLSKFKRDDGKHSSALRLEIHSKMLAAQAISEGRDNVFLSFSPVRRYPSVTVGPRWLGKVFERLWRSAQAVALVSATLYLPSGSTRSLNPFSPVYMQLKLHIPPQRIHTMTPVIPEWVTGTPTVYLPDAGSATALTYPGGEQEGDNTTDLNRWYDAASASIFRATQDAAGGMLVLATAYGDIQAIADRLASMGTDMPDRLIVQHRGDSVPLLRSQFIHVSKTNGRPIWLATGPAWTGLDVSDPERPTNPEEDKILTDLVILRIPFGHNRTSTQHARKESLGFSTVVNEAVFRTRQGLGRLIRRKGVTCRRIWILDGRLVVSDSKTKYIMAPINNLLKMYRQEPFKLHDT